MSKSKSKKGETQQAAVLNTAKDAGVIKSSKTPKVKAKELAAVVAEKHGKKSKNKKVKEPTPEPESEEDSSASSEDDDEDDSEDSESDEETPVKNGTAKVEKNTKAKADSDSDEDSDDESASSDSSDDKVEQVGKNGKVAAADKTNGNKDAASSDESDSSASSEDDEDRDAEKPKAAANDSDSDSSDDDDASIDNSRKEEVEPARATAKRKAEEPPASILKKAKTEASTNGSQGANLFVGSLSWNVDEAWLTEEFQEFGELTGVRVITDRDTGRSKGFAYVEFANADDAAKAHAGKQGAEIDGRRINVDYASSRKNETSKNPQARAKAFGDSTSDPSDTLWIGNLSFSVDQDGVAQAFQEHGTITGIRLPTDRETGAPKGFGYVSFASIDEAKVAFDAMQGYNLEGRSMRIDYSQPRQPSGDFQSRGGRGGGRGGFGDRGRGGFGGRGGGRGGFGDRGGRGGRGGGRGGRGGSTNRGGFGDFSGSKTTF